MRSSHFAEGSINAETRSGFLLCGKTAVVPVGNQIERSFSLKIFRKKGRYSSQFLGLTGIIGISSYHLRFHTSAMLLNEIRGLSVENCTVPFCGKFSPVFPTNGKRSSRSILFAEKLHCSIWHFRTNRIKVLKVLSRKKKPQC